MTPDSTPLTVSFVCTANICRSAYAEVRAIQLLGDDTDRLRIDSAGVYGLTGSPIDAEMGRQALVRGADISSFRASRVDAGFVTGSDLILTAEAAHRSFILEEWPRAFRSVYTFSQFMEALSRAEPDLRGRDLLAAIQKHRPAARSDGDVPDPYRKGPEAAQACADTLDAYLETILGRLLPAG